MTKYLIVNADDFGLSKRVNEAIIQAHRDGIVTSATLMANMPGFHHAVVLAKRNGSLGIGLHVNLSIGKPLSPAASVPSLVGADGFFSDKRSGWREEDIEQEMVRQFDRLVAEGLQPAHLDSHHHIHLEVPSVYSAMSKLAQQERVPMRLHPWSSHPKNGPLSTDRLIMDTYEHDDGTERLLAHMETLAEGTTEMMCHPVNEGGELLALTDRRIKEAIVRHSIRLIDFRQLPVQNNAPVNTESSLPAESHSYISEPTAPGTILPIRRKPGAKKSLSGKTKSASVRKIRAKSRRKVRSGNAKRRRKTKWTAQTIFTKQF